jgi:hypothetical protein
METVTIGNATATGAVILRDDLAAWDAIAAAVAANGSARFAVAGVADADDLAAESYAVWLGAGRPIMTAYDAVLAGVAALRPSRVNATGDAAEVAYMSTATGEGMTLADDLAASIADAPAVYAATGTGRRFSDGSSFAIAYADGYDAESATLTAADGRAIATGRDAIVAARTLALRDEVAASHGVAAANRGTANLARWEGRDDEVAAALREVGNGRGYALRLAVALGWIGEDATPADRLAAMNRARVAVARLHRRTNGGESHSSRD